MFDFTQPDPIVVTIATIFVPVALWAIDRTTGVFSRLWRLARPIKPAPVPYYEVPSPDATTPAMVYPKINPPAKDRTLVAREDELVQMRTILHSRHGVQITGQKGVALKAEGGRGKTSLAREYAERFGPGYDGGCWLRAQSRLTLLADIAALGNAAFELPVPDPVTEAHGLAVLQRIVGSEARWLLVYDNIDDHDEIKALMCHAPNVDVIVTTRLARGWGGFGRIDLEVLDFSTPEGGAVQLLLQETRMLNASEAEGEEARAVAEQLGGLPLALVMGGTLVREEGWSLAQLRDEMAQVLTVKPENGDYPDSVAKAVMLTYERLEPDAKALAGVCAWLAPEGLTEGLFAGAVDGQFWHQIRSAISGDFATMLEDPARLRDALRGLRRWSVLSGTGNCDMHRLTQAVLRGQQEQDRRGQENAKAASAVLAAQFPYDADFVINWPTCRILVPHVEAVWSAVEPLWAATWDKPDLAALDFVLSQAGLFLSVQKDLSAAIRLKRASLVLKEARLGEEDRAVPLALGNLALNLAGTGALAEAQDMIDRAVRLDREHRKGDARADLAGSYMQQASVAFRRMEAGGEIGNGAEAQADTALEQARLLWEELCGAESLEVAYYWNEKGVFCAKQSRHWEALRAYKRAFEITQKTPNADKRLLGIRATNYGSIALELGQAEQALGTLQLAYDVSSEVYAEVPKHPSFVTIQRWLAACQLVLARKGQVEMRDTAKALCAKHGLDFAERQAYAAELPLDPVPDDTLGP